MLKRAFASAMLGLTALAIAHPATAQEAEIGKDEYMANCAACHGPEARGEGPVAAFMTVQPTNLRLLAKNNNNVFPLMETYQTIDGRRMVAAHGTREMPVWGRRYADAMIPEALRSAYPIEHSPQSLVQGRILAIVYYLQTIQEN